MIQSHDSSKPLFLYLAHQAVHSANDHEPLQAPGSFIKKFKKISDPRRKVYAAMVSALDQSVGKVGWGRGNMGIGMYVRHFHFDSLWDTEMGMDWTYFSC